MSISKEEARVVLGLDSGALSSGLTTATQKMSQFAGNVKTTLTSIGTSLVAAFSIGAITSQFEKLLGYVQDIKRVSDTTGINTNLTQDVTNAALGMGIKGKAVETMLEKFSKGLQPGQDPSEELLKLADAMAAVQDPTERSQMAIDAFGESGLKLVPILSQGREGITKLGDAFGRVSEDEIALLDNMDARLDQTQNKTMITVAKGVEGLAFIARGLANLTDHPFSKEGFEAAFTDAAFQGIANTGNPAENADRKKAAAEATKQKKMISDGLKAQVDLEQTLKKNKYERADNGKKILIDTEALLTARRELEDMGDTPEAKRFEKLKEIAELEQKIWQLRQKGADRTIGALAVAQNGQKSTRPDPYSVAGLQLATAEHALSNARMWGDAAHIPGLEQLVKDRGGGLLQKLNGAIAPEGNGKESVKPASAEAIGEAILDLMSKTGVQVVIKNLE
jgi:hypothetical protein